MVMSEQNGLAMHQMHTHIPCRGMVQPNLIMNDPLSNDTCNVIDNHPSKLSDNLTSLCYGCGRHIYDQFVLRVDPDHMYHARCLKCQQCKRPLDESCTCFLRENKAYCKDDYVRLFRLKCDKCLVPFNKNDFVMKAKNKIYHVTCFRCYMCTRELVPGDEFALKDNGALYCKEDNDVIEKSKSANNSSQPRIFASNAFTSSSENNNNINLANHNSSSNVNATEIGCGSDSGSENGSHRGATNLSRQRVNANVDGKPTRVRTVLNEKQLQTLRQCYAANPRPDALMKEQLVDMTGLSPRVIRVWFQNKRCKDKKKTILFKQQMQNEREGRNSRYGTMQGIPMVATSPVRHDSPQGMHPLDVQRYQPPWSSLSDYALNADVNNTNVNTIQQIINQMHGYEQQQAVLLQEQNLLIPHVPQSNDSLTHPDNTDCFVTYVESDESLQSTP